MEYTDEQIKNTYLAIIEEFIEKIKKDEITIYNVSGVPLGIKKTHKMDGILINAPTDEYKFEILFYKNS